MGGRCRPVDVVDQSASRSIPLPFPSTRAPVHTLSPTTKSTNKRKNTHLQVHHQPQHLADPLLLRRAADAEQAVAVGGDEPGLLFGGRGLDALEIFIFKCFSGGGG